LIPKAKRGGGPKTAAGKRATSRNAIKTGAYASITVLPGEDADEYAELENRLQKDFQPADMAETAIVREITSLIWKKLRLERLEHRALIHLLERPPSADEVLRHYSGQIDKGLGRFVGLLANTDSDWGQDAKRIRSEASLARELNQAKTDFDEMEIRCPEVSRVVKEGLGDDTDSSKQHVMRIIFEGSIGTRLNEDSKRKEWNDAIGDLLTYAEILEWAGSHRQEIMAAVRAANEERLLTAVAGEGVRRAHDDLSRSLYRAFAELRKHQDWRYRRAIDITPYKIEEISKSPVKISGKSS
jgi:hypothetical protein